MSRTAVVTGGTRGIGRAIALALHREGYSVAVSYRSDECAAARLAAECGARERLLCCRADVADREQVQELMDRAHHAFGSIDVLVNNAGLNVDRPFLEMTEEEWDRVVDTNMKGVFLCSQSAARYMMEQEDGGIIVNIGASTGIRARTNGINYCAAKAGVLVMTKCLAMELAPRIRVNCVIPGMTRTAELVGRYHLDDPEHLAAVEAAIPLHRLAEPEEIAEVVRFMVSPEARYIHGQKIIVDGGQFMF
ncbi:MAG TPA: 3-oxoacyl-ACP reductase family protein [Longimicrobium sp.]|nr:3-oxoacyl-ACP reductase family protein [Longimicrobium sp.]